MPCAQPHLRVHVLALCNCLPHRVPAPFRSSSKQGQVANRWGLGRGSHSCLARCSTSRPTFKPARAAKGYAPLRPQMATTPGQHEEGIHTTEDGVGLRYRVHNPHAPGPPLVLVQVPWARPQYEG